MSLPHVWGRRGSYDFVIVHLFRCETYILQCLLNFLTLSCGSIGRVTSSPCSFSVRVCSVLIIKKSANTFLYFLQACKVYSSCQDYWLIQGSVNWCINLVMGPLICQCTCWLYIYIYVYICIYIFFFVHIHLYMSSMSTRDIYRFLHWIS